MKNHKLICLEGLAGSGKTTVGELLAKKTRGLYFHFGDGNRLFPYRHFFNTAPVFIMFIYYVALFTVAYFNAKRLSEKTIVIQDKSIAYAMSLCVGLGLPRWCYLLVPSFLLTSFSKRYFLDVPLEERKRRVYSRQKSGGVLSLNDQRSFERDNIIRNEYISVGTGNLIVLDAGKYSPEKLASAIEIK